MNELQIALGLLKYAAILVPAIGEIVRTAVEAFEPKTSDQQLMVDRIKAVLPEVSESEKALDDLVAAGSQVEP